jgi:hypothetical protein
VFTNYLRQQLPASVGYQLRPPPIGIRTIPGSNYQYPLPTGGSLHQQVPVLTPAAATSISRLSVAAYTNGFPNYPPEAATRFSVLKVGASTSGSADYPRQQVPASLGYRQRPPIAVSRINPAAATSFFRLIV